MSLSWTERRPTPADPRAWLIERGEPDEHPLSTRFPERRLHRVAMTDLEENDRLDAAIVGSGLRMVEVIQDDGVGGHVWFEEIPGWSPPSPVEPITPRATPLKVTVAGARRSHHKRRG